MQYYFEIHKGAECLFYNKLGVSEDLFGTLPVSDYTGHDIRRNGPEAPYSIRFLWTDSATGIPQTMWRTGSICISKEQGVEKVADWDRYPAEM